MIHFLHWLIASHRPPLETETSELRRRMKALRKEREAERAEQVAVKQLAETIERYEDLERTWKIS